MTTMEKPRLPTVATAWLLLTAPVVLLDAVFVLNRPKTPDTPHPLGELVLFQPWTVYATYDRRYAPNEDAFVVAQSWMNLLEVTLGLLALLLSFSGYWKSAIKLAAVVSVMTFSKTLLYFVMDFVEGGEYTRHIGYLDKLLMVLLPSSVWIIAPFFTAIRCLQSLSQAGSPGSGDNSPKKRKNK
ncbi:Emopamil binding protein, putative [Trypanosoma equiperdum]|uniref:EXPERA domain-containing protein n=2 Tax=Trypanozoon TaxID=39700 RepID=Q386Y5_TRYB2|nr:hypothetical protein, conserved [Trypanosoma brucei brucei TREU927]EAN79146.1 hypothetical protein, conserved [Trypanosoma brucei brucei TREU927]SCU71216.1 Emopamil binding protein, putative [Trypanosoma equiperdum]